jgi:Zn-dependent M28 family amino/carboxypeptidase
LVAAAPAAVIHVDERLPFTWAKSDGVYPAWVKRHGMPPTATVPYTDAWQWRRSGVRRLRVKIEVSLRAERSQNVIAEIPGQAPHLPALVLTAHHDTQCGNPGADDNASGVVALFALAQLLAGRRHRRTIRFISFGCEEQLSVGAAAYLKAHRAEMAAHGLVVNFDSIASPLGHLELWRTGSDALGKFALEHLAKADVHVRTSGEVTPFFDTFPFNAGGVPSLCFYRSNFSGGRWQHHSRHDTLAHVSTEEVLRLVRAVAPLVQDLAGRRVWPFARTFPPAQKREVRRLANELFEF